MGGKGLLCPGQPLGGVVLQAAQGAVGKQHHGGAGQQTGHCAAHHRERQGEQGDPQRDAQRSGQAEHADHQVRAQQLAEVAADHLAKACKAFFLRLVWACAVAVPPIKGIVDAHITSPRCQRPRSGSGRGRARRPRPESDPSAQGCATAWAQRSRSGAWRFSPAECPAGCHRKIPPWL